MDGDEPVNTARTPETRTTAHLVERETELRAITELIEDLEHGRGGPAQVIGPPGTGRTALLERAAQLAAERGLQVFTARGSVTEAALPYGVLSQLLSEVPELTGVSWLPRLLEDGADATIVQELLCLRMLESARRRPVLLVVDDVTLIDEQSAAWLSVLRRRRAGVPIVLLGAQAGLPAADGGLDPLSSAEVPGERQRVVRLGPLSQTAVHSVVGSVPAPRPPAEELYQATRGNPALLAEALTRSASGGCGEAGIGTLVADTRRTNVLSLLARLPADLAALVRTIAVVGTADETCLRPLVGPLGMTITRALAVLTELGLLGTDRREPMDPELATWVLAATGQHDRDRIRRSAAELGHRRAVPEAEIAELLVDAPPIGQTWALEALQLAARRRREAGDHASAARYYRRALAEPAPEGTAARLRLDLATVAASSCPFTGELRLARAIPASADQESVRTRLSAADLLLLHGRPENATQALAGFDAAACGSREHADLIALHWLAEPGGPGSASLGVPAVTEVDPAQMSPAQAAVAAWLTMAAGRDLRMARLLAQRAMGTGKDEPSLYGPRLVLAMTFAQTDDVLTAASVYDGVIAAASAAGARVPVALALTGRAWIDLLRGRVRAAEDALAEARGLIPPEGRPPTVAGALSTIAIGAALSRDDLVAAQQAADEIDRATESGAVTPLLLFMLGLLELELEQHQGALRLFEECGRRMHAFGWLNPALVPWRSQLAVAAQALGDEQTAAAMIKQEWRLAQAWGTQTVIGRTQLGAGIAEGSDDVVFGLTQAVNALRYSPARVLHVEALLLRAAAQLDRGQTGGVARELREAERLAAAYQLGWARPRLAELKSRLAERPRPEPNHRAVLRRWRSLKPASAELVRRVLADASNADLAAELGITKRAVELRLTSIYRQLEVTGRAELRELFAALDKEL